MEGNIWFRCTKDVVLRGLRRFTKDKMYFLEKDDDLFMTTNDLGNHHLLSEEFLKSLDGSFRPATEEEIKNHLQ